MSSEPDPRVTTSKIVAGPDDLVGQNIVAVDSILYKGEEIHLPRLLPGVPEFVAVAESEVKAEELRERVLTSLTETNQGRWQSDTTLVVEMRSAAASAVINAVVGLEAYANHHFMRRVTDPTEVVDADGRPITVDRFREMSLDERYKIALPAALGVKNPAGKSWWQILRRVQGLSALTRHAIYEPTTRSGLTGERSLAERYYLGEYVGATRMLFSVFEHFSPNWISDERLRTLGDGRASLNEAFDALAGERSARAPTDS
jgi:hypothetical protein